MDKKKRHLTTTQMIIISFFATVFIGGVLLSLPFASASGRATPFIDALFTATTSVCVTGLVVVTTATHWSLLGKIIILILIQIGGLGVITITTTLMVAVGKKISLSSRILLGDAFNLETLKGLVRFLRRVFRGTFIVEGIGALCYVPVFVPEYGMIRGIWYSVFHAISAFCNAGIDIVGDSSFVPYVHNIWVNVVTMALIIFGGIGFIVWWDVLHVIREKLAGANRGMFNMLALHSKIALTMTVFLILSGTLLFALFEWSNPLTIGDFTPGQKLLAACFQSVTTRTAGIATISQKGLTVPSVITSMFLMFIGGSSVGTAGGVKVTTVAVVALSVAATVRGNNDVTCYGRRISNQIVRKSIAIIFISFLASMVAIICMCILENGESVDIIFEIYSALGTVGLSRDYTATIGLAGKIILCICMFLGRIGPITMVIAFTMRDTKTALRLPKGKITVG
ncbi:MAG: potassium transporter KtrB [Lachnospiraceae bacterium]|nr:potassium transporter KtrB [Lachnospiraceae bacterium]